MDNKSSKRKKGILKVIISVVTALAIMTGMIPGVDPSVRVYAAEKTIHGLGTGPIAGPVNGQFSPWTGSYVYYGKYHGSSVKYRVLTPYTTNYGGSTILLDCDSLLENSAFANNNNSTASWSDSDIRSWLNAGFYNTFFTPQEQAAIVESAIDSVEDKIFLLDENEVKNTEYGYPNVDAAGYARKKRT